MMKTYQFDAQEFAKLDYLLNRMISFHIHERSAIELRAFADEIFPLLREVNYKIVGEKISDDQREAISESDRGNWPPTDLSQEEAVAVLAAIYSK